MTNFRARAGGAQLGETPEMEALAGTKSDLFINLANTICLALAIPRPDATQLACLA